MERIARAVGISVIDRDVSIDEAARLIIDRSEQLSENRSRDQQVLVHTLQLKLKSLKERLDLKVIDADRPFFIPGNGFRSATNVLLLLLLLLLVVIFSIC